MILNIIKVEGEDDYEVTSVYSFSEPTYED